MQNMAVLIDNGAFLIFVWTQQSNEYHSVDRLSDRIAINNH